MPIEVQKFGELLKKASEKATDVLHSLKFFEANKFFAKDGDLIYTKNNVCVHTVTATNEVEHCPGYFTLSSQKNEVPGFTLILQWCPNKSLEKYPGRLNTLTPQGGQNNEQHSEERIKLRHLRDNLNQNKLSSSDSSYSLSKESTEFRKTSVSSETYIDQSVIKSNGEKRSVKTDDCLSSPSSANQRSITNNTPSTSDEEPDYLQEQEELKREDSSSPYSSSSEITEDVSFREESLYTKPLLMSIKNFEEINRPAEKFAMEHNMIIPEENLADTKDNDEENSITMEKHNSHLFAVDLGAMKVLRVFFSSADGTCGQLVIANHASQYKIFYFHNGGLDKLVKVFEQWNVLRSKANKFYENSMSTNYFQFFVVRPQLQKLEQHPEEGLYDKVTWEFWRNCINADKIVDEELIKKAIFFCGIEPSLRREAWTFLLGVYPWNSTREQREHIRNDLFIEYQNIRKQRVKKHISQAHKNWKSIEQSVQKDVIRTDRDKLFYNGDENPNLEIMRNILLNYAIFNPQIGYVQGMSDLLSPLLYIIQEEVSTFWCFVGLIQRSIYKNSSRSSLCMENSLERLVDLLQLMDVELYNYLKSLGNDALQLLFAHRWLLLWFKREFENDDALFIWEASWTGYGTNYFHLFVALAIMTIYGENVISEKMTHDEVLLHFNSLSMQMDVHTILSKARGLLYQFRRKEIIPCTLADMCDTGLNTSWDSISQPKIVCTGLHQSASQCPFAETTDSSI
ncbi:TBC1 domain family member 16 [Trichinella murrelli]|uniref:TBC1 domain family member 16 n=1 Tax=Trichinella murrelli TaxID=144512 RepID=A0A0V0U2Z3_9BILA|nr:TBC1 domain family member 16 [Trichinella murrelli]